MKIAAAAYHPQWHDSRDALAAHYERWVGDAAAQGAALLVFPEYSGIEAGMVGRPADRPATVAAWIDHLAGRWDDWVALQSDLARRYGVHILAGSLPRVVDGKAHNTAAFCSPNGHVVAQEKLIPTPYERTVMQITAGTTLRLLDTALGKIGILICYDSEFPLLARSLVAAGADMILVPSCTSLAAGQTRVRQSCRARAIEGQCLIVQAPIVGRVPECEIIEQGTGRVGFFCPPDYGLPQDGIIAQGETGVPGWVIAEIDPTLIGTARNAGQVGNFAHWDEQVEPSKSVTHERLR